ncbi:hypothetical protein NMD1_00922 [Novosphingobium sp. MD-1]|nr:hypothetical protein NMD1_00922 [Novosphingobium sp. MD-1]
MIQAAANAVYHIDLLTQIPSSLVSRSIRNPARAAQAPHPARPRRGAGSALVARAQGIGFPVHHLRSRRRRPQGAAWALGGQEAREGLGGAWRIGAGASTGKQTPAAPIRLAEPGLDATPCLPKPRCNAGSLQGGRRRGWTGPACGDASPSVPGGDALTATGGERLRERPIAARRARPQAALRFTDCPGGTGRPRGGRLPSSPTPDRHSDETRPAARGSGSRSAGLAHRAGHGVWRVGQVPLRPQAGAGSMVRGRWKLSWSGKGDTPERRVPDMKAG